MSRVRCAGLILSLLIVSACKPAAPPVKQYEMKGQVLVVLPEAQQLTIKHEDIAGFMPAMTMNYQMATPALLEGRTPGELITATLEVSDTVMRLTRVTHTGTAPLAESPSARSVAAALLAEGDRVPDTALIDQTDRRRSFAEWQGSLTLVTFIYTRCPDPNFCPLMDQNFATIQRAVAEDPALKGHVKLVSVSFDPEHDTPAVLAAHAIKHRADPAVWTYLTGDRTTIEKFIGRFGVGLVAADKPDMIGHNLRTALISTDGRIVKFYTGSDWTPGAVLADLRTALRQS